MANQPFEIVDNSESKILLGLNENQKAVVKNYQGLSMVSAGPGAGKSKTLVSRAAYMIEKGVKSSSILLFTFTKKAANEIKERVELQMGDKAAGITVCTYHSFCARNLRKFCHYLDYTDNFSIIDQNQQEKLMVEILNKLESQLKANETICIISKFKEHHWSPKEAVKHIDDDDFIRQEALVIYEIYQKRLKENNVMDFDDLLFNMIEILENNLIVRQKIWSKYKYIIADEVQDSSVEDVKLIFLLTNPKYMNLCLIGDSDQNIFSFRGANVNNLFNTVNQYPHQNFVLGQNYRSTQCIVDAAQSLIRYNERPDAKFLFTENDKGEKIVHLTELTATTEAEDIASLIRQIVSSNQANYKDIAILYRMGYLSRNIEDTFIRKHIPYSIVNGVSFYERREIKDIISFLTFFENPKNFLALKDVINIPSNGIGEKSIDFLLENTSQKITSYDIIRLEDALNIIEKVANTNKRIAKKIITFIDNSRQLAEFIALGNEEPNKIIEKIITTFDYYNYLKKHYKEDFENRFANVRELQNIALSFDNVQDFLDSVLSNTKEINEGEDSDDNNKVKLMTIHASKGLEFRFVFIIGANAGIIPSWKCQEADNPQEAIQEERRLFYVAMTRAKENLFISNPLKVIRKGRLVDMGPSSFISQIDEKYITKVNRTLMRC